jgi:hypothetical protein
VVPGGTGHGRIVSVPSGIDCPGKCASRFVAGTQVMLIWTADAMSTFDGFGGACSGLSCTVTATAPAVVTARFTGRREMVTVDIEGVGSVASTPPGIACPGTCSALFDAGTTVALAATPASGQAFVSWFWECAGSAQCNVSADARVGARFGSVPPNRCDTIAIPVLPSPVTRTVVASDATEDRAYCGRVFGDGAGNLYTSTEYTVSNETSVLLPFGWLFATLNEGFAASTFVVPSAGQQRALRRYEQMPPDVRLATYAPDGTVLSSTTMSIHRALGVQARGGLIGIEADCRVTKAIRVVRFEANGVLGDTFELADQDCLMLSPSGDFAGIVDAKDRLLIATDGASLGSGAIPSDHGAARWFDSSGQPLTAWFDLGSGRPLLRPLIGGGVAVHSLNGWVASIASGETVFSAPPPRFRGWLSGIVLGGTAYARVSTGTIDIVDPSSGETCGSLMVPGYFTIGGDGSLLHVDSEGRDQTTGLCAVTAYPNVLR